VLWTPIRIDFSRLVLVPDLVGWFWFRIKVDKITRKKRKLKKLAVFMPDFLFGVHGPYSDSDPELDPH
jgi:hypothetical protein